MRVGSFVPTKYGERGLLGWNGPADGYKDKKLDEQTYRIDVVGSEVTAQKQVIDMALFRAADIAITNGYTHFTVSDLEMKIRCVGGGIKGANPSFTLTAHLRNDRDSTTAAHVYDAAEVTRTTGLAIEHPDGSSQGKQKAYLANVKSCGTRKMQDPAQMKTESELDG